MFGNAEFNMGLHVAELWLGDEIDGVAGGAVDEHALAGDDYELLRIRRVQRDAFGDRPGASRFAPAGEVLAVEQHLSLVRAETKGWSQTQEDCGKQDNGRNQIKEDGGNQELVKQGGFAEDSRSDRRR